MESVDRHQGRCVLNMERRATLGQRRYFAAVYKAELRAVKARVYCRGLVEEKQVKDIVLDTGCSKSMVQQELVPPNKISEKSIIVHGITKMYPLAEVQLEVDGTQLQVEAAVSEKLPVAAKKCHS